MNSVDDNLEVHRDDRLMFLRSFVSWNLSLSLLAVVLSASPAHSQVSIEESSYQTAFVTPLDLLPSHTTSASGQLDLLKWNVASEDPPLPTIPYNRREQFGTWINPSRDPAACLDVRNLVLVRDSAAPVRMREQAPCKVGSGQWNDPYTTRSFAQSHEVQIDHVVPLKDAFINGAWKWNYQARCLYANYMGFRNHLIPVEGQENMQKSDRAPDRYMPPNQSFRCQYLKIWLSVKLIWRLGMQREEARTIKKLVEDEGCQTSDFKMSSSELRSQRATIISSLPICTEAPPEQNTP